MDVVDVELEHRIAQHMLAHKTQEVARLSKVLQNSAADPAERAHFTNLLKNAGQECVHLQAEFQKNFGSSCGSQLATVQAAAGGMTLPTDRGNQSVV